MVRRALVALVVVVLGTLALVGCGSSTAGGLAPEVIPEASREAATNLRVTALLGLGTIPVGTPGERPTVVNLWASWCRPCREEMPAVQRFAASHPDVRVIGVAIDDQPDAAREFAEELGVTFPLGIDDDDRLVAAYGVSGLPTTLVLDRRGRLAAMWAGPVTEADLERLMAPVIGGS